MIITYEEEKETYKTDYIFNVINILNHMEEIETIQCLYDNQHVINEYINYLIKINVYNHYKYDYNLKYEVFNSIKNQLRNTNLNLTFLELINELLTILEIEILNFKYTKQSKNYKKYIISCYITIIEKTPTYKDIEISKKELHNILKEGVKT